MAVRKRKRQIMLSGVHEGLAKQFAKLYPDIQWSAVRYACSEWDAGGQEFIERFEQTVSPLCVTSVPYSLIPLLAQRGAIRCLDAAFSDKQKSQFAAKALTLASSNGKLYALPDDITCFVLLVREDILKKHGFSPPKTWDELSDQLRFFRRTQPNAIAGVQGKGLYASARFYQALAGSNGVDPGVAMDGGSKASSAALIEVYEWLRQAAPYFGGTPSIEPRLDARRELANGNLLYCFTDSGELVDQKKEVWEYVKIVSLPRGPSAQEVYTLHAGSGLVIPDNAAALDLALEVLAKLANPAVSKEREMRGGWAFPTRPALWNDRQVLQRFPFYRDAATLIEAGLPIDHSKLRLASLMSSTEALHNSLQTEDSGEAWLERVSQGRLNAARKEVSNRLLSKALAFIDANVGTIQGIGSVAAEVNRNPDYLNRLFVQHTQQSCGVYIKRRKMERAREMLADVTLSIKEIAVSVGIPNLSSFCRTFHDYWGISATVMRYRITTK